MKPEDLPPRIVRLIKGVRKITAASLRKGKWRKGLCTWCLRPIKKPNIFWCGDSKCNDTFMELQREVFTCRNDAKGKCARCKDYSEKLEIDHIIPVSQGGMTIGSNLQALCPAHHLEKGAEDRKKYG